MCAVKRGCGGWGRGLLRPRSYTCQFKQLSLPCCEVRTHTHAHGDLFVRPYLHLLVLYMLLYAGSWDGWLGLVCLTGRNVNVC